MRGITYAVPPRCEKWVGVRMGEVGGGGGGGGGVWGGGGGGGAFPSPHTDRRP